jgi:predicted nucleic acid-binding protein
LTIYADTSFLVPLYLEDRHSPEVDRRMESRPGVFLTPFHRAEMTHAIYLHVFRGQISTLDAQRAYADFERDCETGVWVSVDLPEKAFSTCVDVARRRVAELGVRTLDTLHVAAALALRADAFWTFDQRQARLAEAEGLSVS